MKKRKTYEVSVINKTYSKTYSDQTKFYTSDTALELNFQLKEVEYDFDSAEIILLNVDDRSLVTRPVTKGAEGFTYELEDDIVEHYGEWKGQLKFNEGGEIYVSSPVVFRIENDLSNDRPPQLTDIRDWETLRQSAKDLIAELGDVVANEAERIEAEKQREETVANIETRQTFVENQFNLLQQEMTDKDVISSPEIIAARNGEANLKSRLDKEQQEVNEQLAQTKKQLQPKPKIPFFVETFASFSWNGSGVPENLDWNKYPDGNYVLNITGNKGDNFVTVTGGGDITDAGSTQKWASVIKHDDGTYESYLVTGTDDVSKVYIYPNLKENISTGLLANTHDTPSGQHLSKEGYKAWIEHIYRTPIEFAIRDNFIDQHRGNATSSKNKWVTNGFTGGQMTDGAYMTTGWASEGNIASDKDDYFLSVDRQFIKVVQQKSSDADTRFIEWEVELNKQEGQLETSVGAVKGSALVEFFLDGELQESKTIDGFVKRLYFRFKRADKGKIKISLNSLDPTEIRIGTTTWWLNSEYSGQLIKPFQKVVYMGDSWGTFHNKIAPTRLQNLMSADLEQQATVINHSKGGMTTNWALDWFDEYVAKENPDVVIFEYFTNDAAGSDVPYERPDGTIGSTLLDTSERSKMEQWVLQYKLLAYKSIDLGIQPILIMPTATASGSQSQTHAIWSSELENGYTTVNQNPVYESVSTSKVKSNLIEGDGNASLVIKSTARNSGARKGVVIDTPENLTGGYISKWANNGVDKAGVKSDGALEVSGVQLQPNAYLYSVGEFNRGRVYLKETQGFDDRIQIVIKTSDGTYKTKKIQLID